MTTGAHEGGDGADPGTHPSGGPSLDTAPARTLAKELAATTSNMLELLQRGHGLRELRSQYAFSHGIGAHHQQQKISGSIISKAHDVLTKLPRDVK